jgi:hypothetical protein
MEKPVLILSREEIKELWLSPDRSQYFIPHYSSPIFVEVTRISWYSPGVLKVEFGFMYMDRISDLKSIIWGGSWFYFKKLGENMILENVRHLVI